MKPIFCFALLVLGYASSTLVQAQFKPGELMKNLGSGIPGGDKLTKGASAVTKVAKGATGISPTEELVIGESVALEIIGKYGGIWRDEAATKRVNRVGRALAYYSTRPALNWKFGIMDSPSINGFSAPGGIVLVTKGLYEMVGASDDALAAVLAHEIAHITGRHALKIIETAEFWGGVTEGATTFTGDGAKTEAFLRKFDLSVDKVVKVILEQGYDAPKEYDADKEARALALTVGYAPGALRKVLLQLQQRSGPNLAIFSTHPPLASRIGKLPPE